MNRFYYDWNWLQFFPSPGTVKKWALCVMIACFSLGSMLAQENCTNGIDDDGDGFVDCADPDCSGLLSRNSTVAQISDDAEEELGIMDLNDIGDDLDFTNNKKVGIRFTGVNLPANATIDHAYISFIASPDNQDGATMNIYAERNLNPLTFATNPNNLSLRTKTTQSANWTTGVWSAGQNYLTPSLAAACQEVVDLAGGIGTINSFVFIFESTSGRSAASSFEGPINSRPVLFIEYSICDRDNDGIVDGKDLDDDNDGIPDVMEDICISDLDAIDMSSLDGSTNPVVDFNAQNYSIFGSVMTFSPLSTGGTATIDDYEINDDHQNGNFGPKIGVDFSDGPDDFVRMHFSFSQEIENFSFEIYDLDDEDMVIINAYRGGVLYNIQPTDFTTGVCIAFVGSNRFNSICGNVGNSNPNSQMSIQFPVAIDEFEIYLAQQFPDDLGGSVTLSQFHGDCIPKDTDGDRIPDYLDLDSDADGIFDLIEAGGVDVNGDGAVDYPIPGDASSMTDADGDGLTDDLVHDSNGDNIPDVAADTDPADPNAAGTGLPVPNTDNFGAPDFQDIDADNDGIVDIVEAQATGAYQPPLGLDSDADGIDDRYDIDSGGNAILINDKDGDGDPDYQDLDSDNDTKLDILEGYDFNYDGAAELGPLFQDTDGDGLDDAFDADGMSFSNANGPTNGGQNPATFPAGVGGERAWRSSASFPVEWLDFTVVLDGKDALLEWSTATEVNTAFFDIERSFDGMFFEKTGLVNAAGNSQSINEYEFVDPAVVDLQVKTIYYRLREVDQDGSFSYSATIELDLTKYIGDIVLKGYTNPAHDIIHLRFSAFKAGNLTLRVVNQMGQILATQQLEYQKGNQVTTLQIGHLAAGIYMLELSNERHTNSIKFIKQ